MLPDPDAWVDRIRESYRKTESRARLKQTRLNIILMQAAVVLLLSLVLAVAANLFRPEGLSWHEGWTAAKLSKAPMGTQVMPRQALSLWGKPDIVFLDARSSEAFAREHVPGAVNLPYDPFAPDLAERIAALPKTRMYIVYCDGVGCPLSSDLAQLMRLEGLDRVLVLAGGIEEWKAAGGSLE